MPPNNEAVDVFKFIDMSAGSNACWPWTGAVGGRKDQPRPYFSIDGVKRLAYHIVWELVNGQRWPEGMLALHECDNGLCCNPRHVKPGTHQQNMDDMRARGRHGLPQNTVKAIKRLLSEGRTHDEIAQLYGVARTTISAIAQGRTYTHVRTDEEAVRELERREQESE